MGDGGAYIEFNKNQIKWDVFKLYRKDIGYYDIYYIIGMCYISPDDTSLIPDNPMFQIKMFE